MKGFFYFDLLVTYFKLFFYTFDFYTIFVVLLNKFLRNINNCMSIKSISVIEVNDTKWSDIVKINRGKANTLL